jgi:hypothetical protein
MNTAVVDIFCAAGQAGHASGAFNAALLYQQLKDEPKMIRWLRRAAELGDDEAAAMLRQLNVEEEQITRPTRPPGRPTGAAGGGANDPTLHSRFQPARTTNQYQAPPTTGAAYAAVPKGPPSATNQYQTPPTTGAAYAAVPKGPASATNQYQAPPSTNPAYGKVPVGHGRTYASMPSGPYVDGGSSDISGTPGYVRPPASSSKPEVPPSLDDLPEPPELTQPTRPPTYDALNLARLGAGASAGGDDAGSRTSFEEVQVDLVSPRYGGVPHSLIQEQVKPTDTMNVMSLLNELEDLIDSPSQF